MMQRLLPYVFFILKWDLGVLANSTQGGRGGCHMLCLEQWGLRATKTGVRPFRRNRASLSNLAQRDGGHCFLDGPARQCH